jgi:23S rRNA pseudouridine1911/1915/1917 synthase
MSNSYKVGESCSLLAFLLQKLDGMSRNKVKQRLKTGCIEVNGVSVSQATAVLQIGDIVEVLAKAKGPQAGASTLPILFQNADLIAIHKPAGLLSVAAAKEGASHALAVLRAQISPAGRGKQARLWPVHRLDRDTSGVLLFATSREVREAVADRWTEAEKTYLAIVEGRPQPDVGRIEQPLRMDFQGYRALVGEHPDAKRAITNFKTLEVAKRRSLLEVKIETGRQHQIRAHLDWLGHAVVGDRRYGVGDQRLGLHALRLDIPSLSAAGRLVFEAEPPAEFSALLN